jgi:hypothetical protein
MKNNNKTQLNNQSFSKEEIDLSLKQFGKTPSEICDVINETEMTEVTTKPLNKVWFEVSNKIKFSNPKKTESTFKYIVNELKEIYGYEVGNMMGNILFDRIEEEYCKLNNGDFLPFSHILRKCSQNKWRKLIDRVNSHMTLERKLLIG